MPPGLRERLGLDPEGLLEFRQLPPADGSEFATAELSTYQNQRVTTIFNDGLQAAIIGKLSPEEAMKSAQKKADRILQAYR